ncbi:hypothetical protein PYCCODRAFT_1471510 [Trametes coccinea BRFM310]|uniref:Uncharacterized protein n=1 Tax=Trametes coccinea (strain BRFM310) TaxID=1353009 RepID=A0A1Y2I9T3_TRAC3|nr:hypothetical protein PYCCODRAFT_1471510 [Trametes coccinea BRFM310]
MKPEPTSPTSGPIFTFPSSAQDFDFSIQPSAFSSSAATQDSEPSGYATPRPVQALESKPCEQLVPSWFIAELRAHLEATRQNQELILRNQEKILRRMQENQKVTMMHLRGQAVTIMGRGEDESEKPVELEYAGHCMAQETLSLLDGLSGGTGVYHPYPTHGHGGQSAA